MAATQVQATLLYLLGFVCLFAIKFESGTSIARPVGRGQASFSLGCKRSRHELEILWERGRISAHSKHGNGQQWQAHTRPGRPKFDARKFHIRADARSMNRHRCGGPEECYFEEQWIDCDMLLGTGSAAASSLAMLGKGS
eukprot:626069-Pelagomonas_calceolata.AAC.9